MKFRKKPVVIDAFQMTKERRISNENWPQWLHEAWNIDACEIGSLYPQNNDDDELAIGTLEGQLSITWGDWIIRGVMGEIYPCKPDIFAQTYEEVLDEMNENKKSSMEAVGELPAGYLHLPETQMTEKKSELTDWISGDLNPVRDGVYQRMASDGIYYWVFRDGYWRLGGFFMLFAVLIDKDPARSQNLPWRGFTTPQE